MFAERAIVGLGLVRGITSRAEGRRRARYLEGYGDRLRCGAACISHRDSRERHGTVRYGYDQYAVVRVSRDLASWALFHYTSQGPGTCPEKTTRVGSSVYCWRVVPLTRIGDTDMLEDEIGWRAKFRLGTCVPWGLTAANSLPACGRSGRD